MTRRQPSRHLPIANWRDSSLYRSAPTCEPHDKIDDPYWASKLWAWQFLRRNEHYRDLCVEVFQKSMLRPGSLAVRKFGLLFAIPEHIIEPEVIPFAETFGLQIHCNRGSTWPELLEDQVAIVFNISRPIPAQLHLAASLLNERRQKFSDVRKRPANYPLYLRILDAVHAGASNREIAGVFQQEDIYSSHGATQFRWFENDKRVEQDIRVARKLSTDGYLDIAYA